jgi:hypothetical protein
MKRTTRFTFIPLVLMLLAIFGQAPRAFADAPTRVDYPFPEQILSGYCAFDVKVEPLPLSNNAKLTTFFDKAGNARLIIITGTLKVQVTNLATGTSKTLNISGPARIVPQPDGSLLVTYLGSGLVWFPGAPSALPPLAFVHGQVETEIDPQWNVRILGGQGHVENVCSMLAGA